MDHFTATERTHVCALIAAWSAGSLLPVDARRITRRVQRWALQSGLLTRRAADSRLIFGNTHAFQVDYDTPIEVLWDFMRPLLNGQRARGRSLARDSRWEHMNCYPEGHRWHTPRDLEVQERILGRLAAHGLLYVQMAGSVWEITDRTRA